MIITGLENNNYLINNSINLLINGFTSDVDYLEITTTNTITLKVGKLILYPINNVFKIDISKIVKSTFNEPIFNISDAVNICNVEIDFKVIFNDETETVTTISKFFIRGGNHHGVYADCVTQKQNYLPNNVIVDFLITNTLPNWGSNFEREEVVNRLIDGVFIEEASDNFETFEIPCKGIEVRFLNQYGTYSQWYFNNYEINDSTKHTDFIDKFSTNFYNKIVKDLGSTVDSSITVKGSVPKRFNELIRHLIISTDVHIFLNAFWYKVILNNSKWNYNSRENTYKHSITFDFPNIINPSDLC
jgi:hypothetical protein